MAKSHGAVNQSFTMNIYYIHLVTLYEDDVMPSLYKISRYSLFCARETLLVRPGMHMPRIAAHTCE